MTWHVLDAGPVWIAEFAAALGRRVPVQAWAPALGWTARLRTREYDVESPGPVRIFPLQRGWAHPATRALLGEDARILVRLLRAPRSPDPPVLVCCMPFYAGVAERWPGPVIYYVTDLARAYEGVDPRAIDALERRLCRVAQLVCPNSQRIADVLIRESGCDAAKVRIIPNATRASNLMNAVPQSGALPAEIAHLPRPVAGVIGNLGPNLDWPLLEEAVERTPWLSWAFVGPAEGAIRDPRHAAARGRLRNKAGQVCFTGARPYAELHRYARAFDVAVLPYRLCEPTYSGSSTRFYEHLAACRPMLATHGFEELLHKEPLLRLTPDAGSLVVALEELRRTGFRDGMEEVRRRASLYETWDTRAAAMVEAFAASQTERETGAYA